MAPPLFPTLVEFSKSYAGVHGYIAAVICIGGIIANLANIVVLTRKNMLSATNTILTWLAVADLLTVTSYLPYSIHFHIRRDPLLGLNKSRSKAWIHFMLFYFSFIIVCHTIAIWLAMILAFFRFLAIWYPMRSRTLCTKHRARLAIATVCVITVIIWIPQYLVYKIYTVPYSQLHTFTDRPLPDSNKSMNDYVYNATQWVDTFQYYYLGYSRLAQTWPVIDKCRNWINILCMKLVPCILLTILTILLIIAMHKANRQRRQLVLQGESNRAHESSRTTAMLLAIVVLFLISKLPGGLLIFSSFFDRRIYTDVYRPLANLLELVALLNNSINFILYCSMSKQFRDTFVQTFCRCCPKS